mmetsp:Transcript_350/g.426  ORF Transcript_350/g.426 Transcript_350/m.426 type:complete len:82 (+) Transcript_350:191-436(+)
MEGISIDIFSFYNITWRVGFPEACSTVVVVAAAADDGGGIGGVGSTGSSSWRLSTSPKSAQVNSPDPSAASPEFVLFLNNI